MRRTRRASAAHTLGRALQRRHSFVSTMLTQLQHHPPRLLRKYLAVLRAPQRCAGRRLWISIAMGVGVGGCRFRRQSVLIALSFCSSPLPAAALVINQLHRFVQCGRVPPQELARAVDPRNQSRFRHIPPALGPYLLCVCSADSFSCEPDIIACRSIISLSTPSFHDVDGLSISCLGSQTTRFPAPDNDPLFDLLIGRFAHLRAPQHVETPALGHGRVAQCSQ